jgi:hypothetical protein
MLDIVETPVGLSSRLQQLISFDDYILFGAALTELGIHRGDLFYARFSPDREIAEIIPFPRVK